MTAMHPSMSGTLPRKPSPRQDSKPLATIQISCPLVPTISAQVAGAGTLPTPRHQSTDQPSQRGRAARSLRDSWDHTWWVGGTTVLAVIHSSHPPAPSIGPAPVKQSVATLLGGECVCTQASMERRDLMAQVGRCIGDQPPTGGLVVFPQPPLAGLFIC